MSSLFKSDVRSIVLHDLLHCNVHVRIPKQNILYAFARSSSVHMHNLTSLFADCPITSSNTEC